MRFLRNSDINRLASHTAVHQLAGSISGAFVTAFLLRAMIAPILIFLCVTAIFVLRFSLRPLILLVIPRLGPRRTLILGTVLFGIQYPVLASVHGVDPELLAYAVVAALAEILYWPSYHILFAALGEVEHRGRQLGAAQMLATIVAVLGPVMGGTILATAGPWPAFCIAAAIEVLAAVPLIKIRDLRVPNVKPADAYASASASVLLIFTNGWISGGSVIAWDIISFRAFSERYETYGGMLSAAALAGAAGGMMLGRLIDGGRGRHATWINATACVVVLALKALCGSEPKFVAAVAVVAALLGGLYAPPLVTVFYNEAVSSTYHLRFQFMAEAGFDAGVVFACVMAIGVCASGIPLQAVILAAIPAIALQARLLNVRYAAHRMKPTAWAQPSMPAA